MCQPMAYLSEWSFIVGMSSSGTGFPDFYLCIAMVSDDVCVCVVAERVLQSAGSGDGGG